MSEQTIPFRIRIGVTGHRLLQDKDELSKKIREVLDKNILDLFDDDSKRLLRSSPNTPLAFNIITPLAEGADRLVAEEVLRLPHSGIDVVLPLAKEYYLNGFESMESREEFEKLFSKARRPVTLRKQPLQRALPEGDIAESRRQAYGDVGRYIVDHCDVLIALWDGNSPRGEGGTAEIVEYAVGKRRPVIIIPTIPPFDIAVRKGYGLNAKSISGIEMFNSFSVSEREKQAYVENMHNRLFDTEEGRKLPDEIKNDIREKLLPYYVRGSKIAKYNQKIYRYAGLFVYTFSALAVASVAIGTLVHGLSIYAFTLELVLLLSILFIVLFAHRKHTHKNWIENRFLTERIRSSIFFAACGVEASPIEVPPYMGLAHSPDDWMVKAFNEIWNRLPQMKGCYGESCKPLIAFIRNAWVQDQIKYHDSNSKKSRRKSHYLERGGLIIFILAVVAALSHVSLSFLEHDFHVEWIEHGLTFAALVLPAAGAAIGGIRTHREYSRIERRSGNMTTVLKHLDERFSRMEMPEDLKALLREMEELTLRETQDWLMLMKFTELEAAP